MTGGQADEKQYRSLFNNIRDALLVADTNRRIIDCNPAFVDLFGYSREEILGKQTVSIYKSQKQFLEMGEAISKHSMDSGFLYVVDFKRKDGSVFPGETNVFYLRDEQGDTTGVVGQIRDVTEHRRAQQALHDSEKRFRTIVEKAPDPIFIQTDWKFAFLNPKALTLFRANAEEELLGKPVMERFHPDFHERIGRRIKMLNEARQPVENLFEQKFIRLDGTEVWVETAGQPIIYKGQKSALVFVRDISERKQAEAERDKLQKQLSQVQRLESVGRMAGGVAHDFNNLLSIILGYSEIVLEDVKADHPYCTPCTEIHNAALRARDLTRQLLAFSRKQVLEIQPIDLNSAVTGFQTLLQRMLGENIELNLALHTTPLIVKADTVQLEQVLMNLAVNARDAMPEGGRLVIESGAVDLDEEYSGQKPGVRPGRYALLAVSDNGFGMEADILDSVFEPFFTTKGSDEGTGLGLATSYGIVKQHDGNIWVYSEPGRGTTFKIYLPLESDSLAYNDPEASGKKPAEKTVTEANAATILVVEDDPSVRNLAVNILKRGGYRVIEADPLEDTIKQASEHKSVLDLVLTDVIMPGMRGPAVFAEIRKYHPEARVLYMSGYTDNVIARENILEEGIHFIQKPFTAKGLLEKVYDVLNKPLPKTDSQNPESA